MADEAFTDLVLRYLDGLIGADEFARLGAALADAAAKRAAFVQLCLQAQAVSEALQSAEQNAAPPSSSRRRWLGGGLAGAAAVLLALSVGWWLTGRAAAVMGCIVELDGAAEVIGADGVVPATVGQELRAGDRLRTVGAESAAALEYLDRTRLELSGETDVHLTTALPAKIVRLAAGRLAAEVPPQPAGQPLELRTPQVAVVVRGTRFSMRTDGSQTRVAVEEGRVELQRPADAAAVVVEAGTVAVAAADAPVTLQPLATIPVQFAGEFKISYVWGAFVFDPVKNVLVSEEKGWIEERDPQSLRVRASVDARQPALRNLALGADGTLAAVSAGQPTVWTRATGQLLRRFDSGRESVNALALAPDGQRVAATCKRDKAHPDSLLVWAATGELLYRRAPESGPAQAVAFSPDNRLLAVGTEHGGVQVLDAAAGRTLRSLPLDGQQRAVVGAVSFSPDGKWLAAGGMGRVVRLWDVGTWQPGLELLSLEKGAVSIAFAPRQPWVAVGFADGWVRLYHRADGRELAQIRVTSREVRVVGFSPDGGTLAATGVMHRVKTWRIGEP